MMKFRCGLNGLMYTDGKLNWSAAPVSIFPSAFSTQAFQYAKNLQPVLNEVVDAISRDRPFLTSQLQSSAESDEFICKLLKIYESVPESILQSGIQFGIHRSDYMVNDVGLCKQIEINTIASSFGCLSKRIGELHSFLLKRYESNYFFTTLLKESVGEFISENHIPEPNPSIERLAHAIASAHNTYVNITNLSSPPNSPVVVFVVQPGERNVILKSKF